MKKKIFSIIFGILIVVFGINNVFGFVSDDIVNEFCGAANRIISPYEKVFEGKAVVKDSDGYLELICSVLEEDENYAKRKVTELKFVCDSVSTDFLFISIPSKSNRNTISSRFGVETNYESIRKDFLKYLKDCNIDLLDIRQYLESQNYDIKDIFYKTDHHWQVWAGVEASKEIARYFNDKFGWTLNILDDDRLNYEISDTKQYYGETGKFVSTTWCDVGDEFQKVYPAYNTAIELYDLNGNLIKSGDFTSVLYDQNTDELYYKYCGDEKFIGKFVNKDIKDKKKILYIKDSFSVTIIPFLILETSDIYVWDMRNDLTKQGLYDYIRNNDFDLVVVAYNDYWRQDMWDFN